MLPTADPTTNLSPGSTSGMSAARAERAELADGGDLAVGRPCFWCPAVAARVGSARRPALAAWRVSGSGPAVSSRPAVSFTSALTSGPGLASRLGLEPSPVFTTGPAEAGSRRCSGSQAWPVWVLASEVTVRFTARALEGREPRLPGFTVNHTTCPQVGQ